MTGPKREVFLCQFPGCDREFSSVAGRRVHVGLVHKDAGKAAVAETEPTPEPEGEPDWVDDSEAFDPIVLETVARQVAVIVTLPPGITQVLVRGLATIVGEPVEVDFRTVASEVWTPADLRGGEFRLEDVT